MAIREIAETDADDFIILAKQLGYVADKEYLITRITNHADTEVVYVAELKGKVIGWIDGRIGSTYLHKALCEIVGLIVDENTRSKGIGRELVKAVEAWAMRNGVDEIIVRSNVKRKRAHRFYYMNGYALKKRSMVFSKSIKSEM